MMGGAGTPLGKGGGGDMEIELIDTVEVVPT
jgi:hypothetical protein